MLGCIGERGERRGRRRVTTTIPATVKSTDLSDMEDIEIEDVLTEEAFMEYDIPIPYEGFLELTDMSDLESISIDDPDIWLEDDIGVSDEEF